jgi:hypothetical protein
MATAGKTPRKPTSASASTPKSERKSITQRALAVPRTALSPLTKVEQRVVSELSSATRRARKRVGL